MLGKHNSRTTPAGMRRTLCEILELAKNCRDAADFAPAEMLWNQMATLAYRALGEPTMAEIDEIRNKVDDSTFIIDTQWVVDVGFRQDDRCDWGYFISDDGCLIVVDITNCALMIRVQEENDFREIAKPAKREDVRQLCEVLKIHLKETSK